MNAPTPATGTLLLRVDEAAAELRVSKSTVHRMVASGDLPAVHIGESRRLRISREALADYIASNTRQA